MKLVIDMSALPTDKRKMVVDYLQDNEVPMTWAAQLNSPLEIQIAHGERLDKFGALFETAREVGEADALYRERVWQASQLNPTIDFGGDKLERAFAAIAKGMDAAAIPRRFMGFDLASGKDRTVSAHPALAAPYGSLTTKQWADAATARSEGMEPKNAAEILEDIRDFSAYLRGRPELFLEQYMCVPKPDPLAWIPHHGGPCPVNHEEVEVELRGDHRPGKDVATRSLKRRGMPESFVWQWGRPHDPTSRNDVLNWRLAQPVLRREEHKHRRPNEVTQCCHGTSTKHRWGPTRYIHFNPTTGVKLPVLECVHCRVRVYGPYEELPLHLLNEDDPRVNMHWPD